MNNRQRKTLDTVFSKPTRANIPWADIESLLIAVGCEVVEGSRVRFDLKGVVVIFHRPHPAKEAMRYQVREARDYLTELEMIP